MNPYDLEPTPMHFNKGARIFAAVMLVFLSLCFLAPLLSKGVKDDDCSTTVEETTCPETTFDSDAVDTTVPEETDTTDGLVSDTESDSSETTIPDTTIPETTLPDTTVPEETLPPVEEAQDYVILDETEKLIFATIIRLECGGSSYETKRAVASVVVNRMKMWNMSLRDVVFAKNQFSPAYLINKKTGKSNYNPSKEGTYAECWTAVEDVCKHGPTIPSYVFYFRSGHYHNWSTLVNYAKIGPLYFSYAPKYTKVCPHCDERFTTTEYKEHKNNCPLS